MSRNVRTGANLDENIDHQRKGDGERRIIEKELVGPPAPLSQRSKIAAACAGGATVKRMISLPRCDLSETGHPRENEPGLVLFIRDDLKLGNGFLVAFEE